MVHDRYTSLKCIRHCCTLNRYTTYLIGKGTLHITVIHQALDIQNRNAFVTVVH